MSVLSDSSIRAGIESGHIGIEPYDERFVQPASYDVRIGPRLRVYRHSVMLPVTTDADWRDVLLNARRTWTLSPGHAYLAATFERITVPDDLLCFLHGRSSVARLFVSPHQEAGLLDPGYTGHPTLELTVVLPVELGPYDPIAQLVFHALDRPAERPYGHPERRSRYQGDTEPTPARRMPS